MAKNNDNTYKTIKDFEAERDALLANELRFNHNSLYLEDNQEHLSDFQQNMTSITEEEAHMILTMTLSEIQDYLGVSHMTATAIYRSIYPYAEPSKVNPNGRTKHAMMQAVARLEVLDTIINTRKALGKK